MIRQTLSLLLDAYRDLNARKLFWVTLILSGVFIIAFGLLGVDETGIKFAWLHLHLPGMSDGSGSASVDLRAVRGFYYAMFSTLVIGLWLTWAATILALISTAGIFPDFVSGGSIDLYLSKPISRARLFLTKYFAGLLFVSLQVLVVAVGSFLVIGGRAGEWKPGLFWMIPIVVCFFSYLFSICVIFGVATRSTIAALLLTVLCWTTLAILDRGEPAILTFQKMNEWEANQSRQQVQAREQALRRAEQAPNQAARAATLRQESQTARHEAEQAERTAGWLRKLHLILYDIKTVTPKTTDTINLLDGLIVNPETEAAADRGSGSARNGADMNAQQQAMIAGANEAVKDLSSRSTAWVIGTSLGFELVLLLWAGWIFCRRDY